MATPLESGGSHEPERVEEGTYQEQAVHLVGPSGSGTLLFSFGGRTKSTKRTRTCHVWGLLPVLSVHLPGTRARGWLRQSRLQRRLTCEQSMRLPFARSSVKARGAFSFSRGVWGGSVVGGWWVVSVFGGPLGLWNHT